MFLVGYCSQIGSCVSFGVVLCVALQGETSLLIFGNVFCDAQGKLVACSIDRPHPPLSGSWLRGAFYDCLLCDSRWFFISRSVPVACSWSQACMK